MDLGLKNIFKFLISIYLIFLLIGCMPNRVKIADLQSQVVTLTIECNKGNEVSCNKLPEKKQELKGLLE